MSTPTSVTRADVLAAIKALGFNPDALAKLVFSWDSVTATVYECDEKGTKLLSRDRQGVLMYEIRVPIGDQSEDDASEPTQEPVRL